GSLLQGPVLEDGHLQRAQLHDAAPAAGAGRQAQAVADHHAHDGAGRGAQGLRDLRPEGGSRDQGDAPALSQERCAASFRRSSRMRGSRETADAPWSWATISPFWSITTV